MTSKEALNKAVESMKVGQTAARDGNEYIFKMTTMDVYFYSRLVETLDLEERTQRKGKKSDKKQTENRDILHSLIATIENHMNLDIDINELAKKLESD